MLEDILLSFIPFKNMVKMSPYSYVCGKYRIIVGPDFITIGKGKSWISGDTVKVSDDGLSLNLFRDGALMAVLFEEQFDDE